MTFESEPVRGPRPVVQRRRRGALAPTLAILGVLVALALVMASVYTDWLWYQQLGYTSVYRTQLLTQAGLFLAGALVMGGAVYGSLFLAYRSRPIYAPVGVQRVSLDRYRDTIEPLRRLVVLAVPVVLGLFAGSAASQQWQIFLLWWNRVPFGQRDVQFNLDIGFFVFTLPWLQFVTGFLTAVVFLAALAGVITHYLYGGLRLQAGAGPRFTPTARMHLASLAAAFLVLRALEYWVSRYELTTKDSRLITGLTYTDATATLTARGMLAAITVIVAALFIVAAFSDRWPMIPVYGVVLLVISAILVGAIYPALVQRFQVTPSAATLEQPYIKRNIDATRAAYDLSDVEVQTYAAKTQAGPEVLRADAERVTSIRLIDPTIVSDAFRQLEQIKQYYSFGDSLDVDRYTIDGDKRDVVIALREINVNQIPPGQRNWVNDKISYTHGYGVVAAYGNQRSSDGKPVFAQQGIPSTGVLGEYEPRIYFGEQTTDYSIVGAPEGAPPREIDFPDDASPNGERRTNYAGRGGVPIGSALNKLLFAIKFREQNILLSDAVNERSRILYDRTPRERVEKVAPYLTLDGDPYPAIVNGRITWILDGYTTTDRFPYSRTTVLEDITSDSVTETTSSVVALQSQAVNYMRNAVKATVDAYDGSVTLYAWDESDPLLKAWQKAFPTTVKPLSAMSGDLISHVRYPEDLFKVQRSLLSTYHVQDPGSYFNGQDFWAVPPDPTSEAAQREAQPPYYLTLQMPGQNEPKFSLTSTFIPRGQQARNVLTGFLSVSSDAGSQNGVRGGDYGKLRLLQLPREPVVPGPGQMQVNFNADPTVQDTLFTLRGGRANGASQVENGNLLTLPLGGGLLYVQPVYVRGAGGGSSYPLLQRVLVGFGDRIGFADTLEGALDQVFAGTGGTPGTPTPPVTPPPGSPTPTPSGTASPSPTRTGTGDAQADLTEALQDAAAALKESDEALKRGDFTAYGAAQKRLSAAIERALDAQRRLGQTSSGATAKPSPSPTK